MSVPRPVAVLVVSVAAVLTFTMTAVSPVEAACTPLGCVPDVGGVVQAIPGVGAAVKVVGSVAGAVGGAAAGVAGAVLDAIGSGIADAVGRLLTEVSEFLTTSSSPQVTVGSFVGEGGTYHRVAQLAALLMVLFIFLGVIQGVVAGDVLAMIGRTLRNVPLAVLAIFGFPWLVGQMVELVDAVCASLLPSGSTLATIAKIYVVDQGRVGIPAILLLLFAFVAAVVIYAELVVRAALVTLVVALSPLSFAAMVWPAARGAARKAVELVVALVVSKLAIWVALALGIDMFKAHSERVVPGGQSMGQMIAGGAILAVAVFAPFVVWRLIPVVEAATVAHGLSRMPSRAAMTAAHTATTLRSLRGGSGGGSGPGQAKGDEHPALADLPSASLGTPGGLSGGGAEAAGIGSKAGSGGATAAGGSVGAAGGAAAAAPVVVAAAGAKPVKDRVTKRAVAQSQSAESPDSAHGGGGWSFRPEEE
ncbi:MAG TPA: hypothetical protein VM938_07250 [Acidimicrobiales bacterium]|nr:hypothetical protein [Acidimicrobiales bacterium]